MTCSRLLFGSALAFGVLLSSCAFLDQRVPCANASECGGGICGSDGFCDTTDLGDGGGVRRDGGSPEAEPDFDSGSREPDAGPIDVDAGELDDAGVAFDAGTPVDAGAQDAGIGDAGTLVDAGPAATDAGASLDAGIVDDAGEIIDAGDLDAGAPDGGVLDAGVNDLDAGAPDAGVQDAGSPDAGVCTVGSQTDPTNCGACGFTCASGVCAAGICGPQLVVDHPALIREILVDNGDVYFADDEGNLFRGGLGVASALLETGLDTVNLEAKQGRIVATTGPAGGFAYRIGNLPLPTLNSMSASPFVAGELRGTNNRGFGLAVSEDYGAFGYEGGLAVVNLGSTAAVTVGDTPLNAPIFVEDDRILSVDNEGVVFRSGVGPSPGHLEVAQLNCPGAGIPARVSASEITALRVTFAANCGSDGVGYFSMDKEQTGAVNAFFVVADAALNARPLSVSRATTGALVGLVLPSGFLLRFSDTPGNFREWHSGSGTLVDVETDFGFVYYAEDSRIFRFEIPPP